MQPVKAWRKVSDVDGVVKYDVNVVTPDDNFHTAQVKVTGDDTGSETAKPLGVMKDTPSTFDEDARDWLRDKEQNTNGVFAISVDEVFEQDEVVEATAYMTDNTETKYVVKRRNGSFEFQETNG